MSESPSKVNANWNLAGHSWAVDILRQHVLRGTARHAYLITGPRGAGRRTLALRFAQALMCESLTASGVPCGQCFHCKHLEIDLRRLTFGAHDDDSGGHPDLRYVEPVTKDELKEMDDGRNTPARPEKEGAGAAGRGARSIRIEQIRAERDKIILKPYLGRFRILLISRFEEATTEASNALLKTLEEAPGHAVLIITASDAESLLSTIVSRCEVLRLKPVPLAEVQTLLMQHGADEQTATLIAHVSAGSPGTALRLLNDKELLSQRQHLLKEMLSLLPATRAQRFAFAGRIGNDRNALREVLLLWISFWRDVMWRAGGAASTLVNIDSQNAIEAVAGDLTLAAARRIVSDLDAGLHKLDTSINGRLLVEVLLMDWPRLAVHKERLS